MRDLYPIVDAADDQAFLAPIKLVCLAGLEGQRDEGIDRSTLALGLAPRPDVVGHPGIAPVVARCSDLSSSTPTAVSA